MARKYLPLSGSHRGMGAADPGSHILLGWTRYGQIQPVGHDTAVSSADGSLGGAVLDTCYGAAGVSMCTQRERSLVPWSLMALIR